MFYSFLICAGLLTASISCLPSSVKQDTSHDFRYLGFRTRVCSNGKTIMNEYHVSTVPAAWGQAFYGCRQIPGDFELVSIEETCEDDLMKDLMLAEGIPGSWTSGMPLDVGASWIWASTENLVRYFNWREDFTPINIEANRILISGRFSSYGWQTVHNQLAHPYICENGNTFLKM